MPSSNREGGSNISKTASSASIASRLPFSPSRRSLASVPSSKFEKLVTQLQTETNLANVRKLHQYLYHNKNKHHRLPIASTADSTVSIDALYYERNSHDRHHDLIAFAVHPDHQQQEEHYRTAEKDENTHLLSVNATSVQNGRMFSRRQSDSMFAPAPYEDSLGQQQAESLFHTLLRHAGLKQNSKLDEKAFLALQIFCYLTVNDRTFLSVVEHQNISVMKHLRLKDHIMQGSDEHKKVVAKLVLFLSTHVKRLEEWKKYVAEKGHEEMNVQMEQLTNIIELTKNLFDENHLPPPGSYHDVSAQAVPVIFKTNAETGLSNESVEKRREKYGPNTLPKPKRPSVLLMLLRQIFDFMVLMLIAAAGISIGMQDYAAGAVLLVVVLFNVIVGFSQEWKAERAMSSLMSVSVQKATVIRDGHTSEIPATELVPGDIVVLDEGIQVPADVHLIEAHDLAINEALLTGESLPSEKDTLPILKKNITVGDRSNMAFMSTYVTKGRGRGVVVSTGKSTEIGKISQSLNAAKVQPTRLQRHLKHLGLILVAISLVVCLVVTVIGFIRKFDTMVMVKTGVSLAVSVIPEGLVAVTTFTMALSVQRMAKKHVIVRKMPSVETLGSVTVICCDKTGTVTEGKMEMNEIYACDEKYRLDVSGQFFVKNNKIEQENLPEAVISILRIAALCNNATIQERDASKQDFNERYEVLGDPTEVAILVSSFKANLGKHVWVKEKKFHFEKEFAFDSDRKRMTVVYSQRGSGEARHDKIKTHILTKGAPESIIDICSTIQQKDGQCVPLTQSMAASLKERGLKMAGNGLRVLGMAHRSMNYVQDVSELGEAADIEQNLCFLGFVGLIDPPRVQVAESIKTCRKAGIRVCMITGDHPSTARYVAQKLHIISSDMPDNSVLLGKDIDQLSSSNKLETLEPFPQVFARVSPENKIQIVEALQKRGEVVAMIGDGINDAGSIKRSDVGVAMGKFSTDVAKESATIVLADNNFSSIVEAVREGRHTFDNIKIFVLYLLSCNFSELLIMFIAIAAYAPIPFSPIQILWANLIADTPPALSLGVEPVDKGVLKRLPRNPKMGLFTYKGWMILTYQCLVMTIITLAGFLISYYVERYTLMHARSFAFALLISVQLVHAFHSRSICKSILTTGFIGNWWLIAATIFSFSLVVIGIYVPHFNRMLDFVPLNHWDWFKVVAGCCLHSIMVDLSKIIVRRFVRRKAPNQKFYSDV